MKQRKKKNNENLVCIVHYPNKDESKYTDIKEISTINEEGNSVYLFQTRSIMINMVYI